MTDPVPVRFPPDVLEQVWAAAGAALRVALAGCAIGHEAKPVGDAVQRQILLEVRRVGHTDSTFGVGAEQHYLDVRPVGGLALPLAVSVDGARRRDPRTPASRGELRPAALFAFYSKGGAGSAVPPLNCGFTARPVSWLPIRSLLASNWGVCVQRRGRGQPRRAPTPAAAVEIPRPARHHPALRTSPVVAASG